MNFNRKGQAAVEYLVILAVVIIIALVVVGVLGGFPALTRGVSEKDSATYWTSADVGLARYVATGTNVTAILRNNRNFAVRSINTTTFGAGTATGATFAYSGTLGPGETTSALVWVGTLPAGSCVNPGDSWSIFPVTFKYTDATYGTTYTFVGGKPLAGTCA